MNEQHNRFGEVQQWIKIAESDFRTAELLLKTEEESPFEAICFHAQQCAEKYLKALLVHHSIDFPKTHDLVMLMNLFPPQVEIDLRVEEVLPLNRYAVEARYPGGWEPITREEAEEAVAIGRKVRESVRLFLLNGTGKN